MPLDFFSVALLALPEEAQATLLSPDTHVNLQLEDTVAHGVFVDWVHQRGVDPAAEGQLRGVVRMVEAGEGCLPVAQQLTAVRKALDAALSRMTVCYLEQEFADAAKADPAIARTIEKVGVLINRLG